MVALGSGAQQQIETQVRSAGTNMITIRAGNFMRGGVSQGMGGASTLKAEDIEAIRKQVASVQYAAAGVNTRDQVIAAGQNWMTRIEGTDVELPRIRSWPTKYGAFFSPPDVRTAAKVAVLGSIVSERLFGEGVDSVGETIRIRNQPFRVIGVMAAKGSGAFGEDQDDSIFVPYTTVQKKLRGREGTNIQSITLSAYSADEVRKVAGEAAAVLRVRHGLMPGEEDDFMVRSLEDMSEMRTQMTQTMTSLLAGIAGVSLIVGGIGIMNIMLVSVTERTREIGLRMAIGAKSRDVLFQFLVEAIVLSLFGGVVGIALGFGVAEGVTRFMQWPTAVPLNAIFVAVGYAAATGIFFGFYPAQKAARLDPIESLRFE
jgi:putative ABC transport system permease protein